MKRTNRDLAEAVCRTPRRARGSGTAARTSSNPAAQSSTDRWTGARDTRVISDDDGAGMALFRRPTGFENLDDLLNGHARLAAHDQGVSTSIRPSRHAPRLCRGPSWQHASAGDWTHYAAEASRRTTQQLSPSP